MLLSMAHWWHDIGKEKPNYAEKNLYLWHPRVQTSQGLAWDRTTALCSERTASNILCDSTVL